MATDSNTRKHHPFSPSKLAYLEACAPWIPQDEVKSAASESGTRQHDATESEDPTSLDDPNLTDAQCEAVVRCKKFRDDLIASHPGCQTFSEQYTAVDNAVIRDSDGTEWVGTSGGYYDFKLRTADKLHAEIIDWKFGAWSVEDAETNIQGICYALGERNENPLVQTVGVWFVMPHRNEISHHVFDSAQLDKGYLRVLTVVERAKAARFDQAARAQLEHPTTSGCLFCGRKAECSKLWSTINHIGHKFAPLQIPADVRPFTMTDHTQAKSCMELAMVAEGWAKAVRGRITDRAISDESWMPEGYALRERSPAKVKDWRKFLAAARKKGVLRSKLIECLTVKVEPAYESIRALQPRGMKDKAEEQFRDELVASGISVKESSYAFLERLKT